jgi:hypothetical protein
LFGAPGPTAITVASGRGLFVADVGRKMPVAVFCKRDIRIKRIGELQLGTHRLSLESLDENTVKQRNKRLDGLESCLGSLVVLLVLFTILTHPAYHCYR